MEANALGSPIVREPGLGLEDYADADHAVKTNNRRSLSGIAVIVGDTL